MRIFVTGAAGFIGSRLCKALLARGDEVAGFDNMNDYYPLSHKERHLRDLLDQQSFSFIKGDLRDAENLRSVVAKVQPQAIAHLAGMAAVRYSVEHPLLYGEVNVQGSVNLFEAARQIGTPALVMASTGSVYGADTSVPFQETAAAVMPLAPYPASKRGMELFAYTYHHLWKLPTTILRFFNVYGPHGRPDMMPWQWTEKIERGEPLTLYDGGKLKRDWTYVDDILSGFIAAIDTALPFEIMNLGCSRPVENLEFVRVLEKILNKRAEIVDAPKPPSEPQITYADISKARRLLGYEPKVLVEDGLRRFIDWKRSAAS